MLYKFFLWILWDSNIMINVFFIDVIFESFFLSICWVIKIDEIRFIFYWKDRWWKVLKGYRFFLMYII